MTNRSLRDASRLAGLALVACALAACVERTGGPQGRAPENTLGSPPAASARGPAPAPAAAAAPAGAPADSEESKVWAVPIAGAPSDGPGDALVTIVEFSDFQCPYCKRVQPTLDAIKARYPGLVRIVFRHQPLPFHEYAKGAAAFTVEARAERGDAGFWKAAALVFEASPDLDTEALVRAGHTLGLDERRVRRALAERAENAAVLEDQGLADDFGATGTPHFFVNGRRLVGAQPEEAFAELVDEELAKARRLVEHGVPKTAVYDEVMRTGLPAPGPERLDVAPPGPNAPARGPADAPVVIQMFGDLECPFCRRGRATVAELERLHPGKIRVVYRHLPLDMHPGARAAAVAAQEAFAQKGPDAFWKMADLLESELDDPAVLTRADLLEHAMTVGLDLGRFAKALDDGRHDAVIDADVGAALAAGIHGTPAFLINGYHVAGARPLAAFERLVRRALAEAAPAAQGGARLPVGRAGSGAVRGH